MNPNLRLRVSGDSEEPRVLTLERLPITIGRDPSNALRIGDGYVSRFHAVLEHRDRVLVVSDLDSRNGTFIGGRRVARSTTVELPPDDLSFQLGIRVVVEVMAAICVPDRTVVAVPSLDAPTSHLDPFVRSGLLRASRLGDAPTSGRRGIR